MKNYTYLFPGQGSQAIGMGKEFYNLPENSLLLEEASDRLKISLKELLFAENKDLEQTQYAQPAILLTSIVSLNTFNKYSNQKISAKSSIGHSLGEYSALVSTGALNIIDAVELVHIRGLLMRKSCQNINAGMMVVLSLTDDILENFCKEKQELGLLIWCANYNTDGQLVLAGKKDDLSKVESELKALGAKRALLLNMSIASHCPLLESMKNEFNEYLLKFIKDDFSHEIISNVTAKPYKSKAEAVKLLSQQLTSPVLYKQSIANVDSNTDEYIEFGHGGILKGLNKKLTEKPSYSFDSIKNIEDFLKNNNQ